MSKTANILKYIKYVQTKGKQYEDILEKTHRKNKDNLFDFVEETTDLFVNKKVPITDSFYKAVNDRYNNIENELNSLKGDLIDLNAVTTKVNNYFWGFRYYSLDRNYYYTDVTNRLN